MRLALSLMFSLNQIYLIFPVLYHDCHWRSQDFHQGGARLESEVVMIHDEAAHGEFGWPYRGWGMH